MLGELVNYNCEGKCESCQNECKCGSSCGAKCNGGASCSCAKKEEAAKCSSCNSDCKCHSGSACANTCTGSTGCSCKNWVWYWLGGTHELSVFPSESDPFCSFLFCLYIPMSVYVYVETDH